MYRVGGIGTGRIFQHAHVPAYVHLSSVCLAAIYDPDPQAAEKTRAHYLELLDEARAKGQPMPAKSAPVICQNPEELLDQVDMIDICAPVRWHPWYAAAALERDVHVMTEKPMARTWWEARHVAEVAKRSNAYFQLNDDNLWLPRYRILRKVIESGIIGEVQAIWLARGYEGTESTSWFWQPLEAGGGCVMDYGTHAVTSTWFLLGYDKVPVEVRSLGVQTRHRTRLIGGRFQPIEVDDDAHFKIRFVDRKTGDWMTVVAEATWSWAELGPEGSDVRGYLEVQGSLGTAWACVDADDKHFIRVKHRSFGERTIPFEAVLSERESFQSEIENFVQSIEAGAPSILNAEVGVAVMSLLNSVQLSELRGRVAVTPEHLGEFSRQTADNAPDLWTAGDRIIAALNAPYRLS